MVGAAAGMASCGKIPFAYTISAFIAYRAYEFLRDDVCFQNQNVKLIGIGSGLTYSTLGPSHHTTEDIAFGGFFTSDPKRSKVDDGGGLSDKRTSIYSFRK